MIGRQVEKSLTREEVLHLQLSKPNISQVRTIKLKNKYRANVAIDKRRAEKARLLEEIRERKSRERSTSKPKVVVDEESDEDDGQDPWALPEGIDL